MYHFKRSTSRHLLFQWSRRLPVSFLKCDFNKQIKTFSIIFLRHRQNYKIIIVGGISLHQDIFFILWFKNINAMGVWDTFFYEMRENAFVASQQPILTAKH
jgi:hypothetical protein